VSSQPIVRDYCWEIDTSCCGEAWDAYDSAVTDRALALAASSMRALTGFRVGGCPTTVRPCVSGCGGAGTYYGSAFTPLNWNGVWSNCGCGVSGCVHNGLTLPAPVGRIDEVKIDGIVLDPTGYRLVGNVLLRTDFSPWPTTQNLTLEDSEVGTWSVTYLNAYEVDEVGAYVAGMLACQFAKACSTGKCDLPASVTQVARAGITMTMTPGVFPNGLTGIREVDAYILSWNPNGLRVAPSVWVPGGTMYS
jgi:hypothetical protein